MSKTRAYDACNFFVFEIEINNLLFDLPPNIFLLDYLWNQRFNLLEPPRFHLFTKLNSFHNPSSWFFLFLESPCTHNFSPCCKKHAPINKAWNIINSDLPTFLNALYNVSIFASFFFSMTSFSFCTTKSRRPGNRF